MFVTWFSLTFKCWNRQIYPERNGVEYVKGYQQEGGRWLNEEQLLHIKLLELKAVKLALLAFNKQKTLTAVHFQIDNTNALLYLVKNGRNSEPNVAEIKRRNLAVSLETPDHNYWRIPSNFLNVEADWQSRNSREASEWKLWPKVFQELCQRRGMPKIDLFVSRLSHQLPQYFASKLTLSVRG